MQCLTIVDEFTKLIFIIPVKILKAGTTADAVVKNVFLKYGYPKVIHSDNSKSFCNQVTDELCRICGIEKKHQHPITVKVMPLLKELIQLYLFYWAFFQLIKRSFGISMQTLQHIVIIPLYIRQLDTLHSLCCLDGNLV